MKFPLGAMTVGDVLDRGLKLMFARLPVFYAINLLVLTPAILIQIAGPLVLRSDNPLDPAAAIATLGVIMAAILVTTILQPIGTAAILFIIMEEYVGRRPTIGQAFSFALTRFMPLLGTSILVGLIIVLGLCCLIAPGVYFAVSYIFIGQVVVLEKLAGGDAMSRSKRLISGHRGRVLGILLLIVIAMIVVQVGLGLGLNAVLPSQKVIPVENGGFRVEINPVNHIIDNVVTQLVQILFSTYLAVCTTLLYLDLRIRKEGFDLELAAEGQEQLPPEDVGDERDDLDDYGDRRRPPRPRDDNW